MERSVTTKMSAPLPECSYIPGHELALSSAGERIPSPNRNGAGTPVPGPIPTV